MQQTESPVTIQDGYLYVGKLKLCHVNGQTLEFYDRSKIRREKRGESIERANILDLVKAVAALQES